MIYLIWEEMYMIEELEKINLDYKKYLDEKKNYIKKQRKRKNN